MLRRVMTSFLQASKFQSARFAGRQDQPQFKKSQQEDLAREPEYKGFKSVDQIQKGKQAQKAEPWKNDDHLSANDEINHRGIDQRAKEWGVPVEKLEKLKPWEHQPSESDLKHYKKTVFGKEQNLRKGFEAGSQRASEQQGAQNSKATESKFNDLASGTKQWEGKVQADRKYTDKNFKGEEMAADRKFTDKDSTRHQVKESIKAHAKVLNPQNTAENFDQGMVDKAMDWVKGKFGGSESSGKQGPTAEDNALNKGKDNHRDAVHKATFTKYEDAKKPFSSSTEQK